MKTIAEIYPEFAELGGGYSSLYDYGPLIEGFGYEVAVRVDDEDYQGDTRILYRDGGKYGVLIFGWGSCSGCDALQACSSLSEVEELQQELHTAIKWYDTAADALLYFNTHDWEGDYCWHQEETRKFIEEAKEHLRAVIQ